MSAQQSDVELIVRQALDNLNSGNVEQYLQIYDSNAILHGYPGVEPGMDSIKRFYQSFVTAFPDANVTIEDIVIEKDKIACRYVTRGTHKGEFMGMPPTNKQISVSGITILHFKNGKCIERWTQADFLGMLRQLGASQA